MRRDGIWTIKDIQLMMELYPDSPTEVVAGRLNKPARLCHIMASYFGIKKSAAYRTAYATQAGIISGARNTRRLPIGTITVKKNHSRYKEKFIKVAPGKFEPLRYYLWKKHKGRIPRGRAIVFKDGDRLNCRLSNLRMVTSRDVMLRNSQSDAWMANYLSVKKGMGYGRVHDGELHKELLKHPALLEAKRKQLKLAKALRSKYGRKA